MLKNILNLEGTQKLNSAEKKSIKGGITEACANAWASMSCFRYSNRNCPPSPDGELGIYMCGKCCY